MAEKKAVETYYEKGEWKKGAGRQRASSAHATKAEAQAKGHEQAKSLGVEHIIKKKDGTIGDRNSYGRDPHPPKY